MKGKIKILSLLLAVAMTASMFVACTDPEGTTTTSGDSPTSVAGNDVSKEPVTPPSERDPVKLKWYMWGDSPKRPDEVHKALNEKSMADIKTEIEFIYSTGNDEAVKMMCSTGGEFDIVFSCNWWNNYVLNVTSNSFADITDLLPTVTPELNEFIPSNVWAGVKVGGKIYGVPTYKDSAPEQFWMVNKSYVIDGAKAEAEFKATGEKLSTVTPLLEKVKKYNDDGNPYPNDLPAPFNFNDAGLNGHDTGWDALEASTMTGIRIDVDTTVKNYLEDADYIESLKVIKDWNTRGLVNRNAMQVAAEYEFLAVGTVQGWVGCEAVLTNKFKTDVVINHKYGPVYTTGGIQGSIQAISPNSKNKERALQYIEYMNVNRDYRNMLAYGIEGKTWEKTPEGSAKRIGDDYMPAAFSQAAFFTMLPEAPSPADMFDNLKSVMDNAKASPLIGFIPDISSVSTEITACNAIIEPVKKEFLTGTVKDVDAKVKETLDKLNGVGYAKIKETIQSQVDAFIAAK